MVWYDSFGPVFFLGIGTFLIGLIHLSVKYCYRIKISECECCCIKIHRDIESEMKIDIIEGDNDDKTNEGKNSRRKSSALNMPTI